jgi:hypothetical protein
MEIRDQIAEHDLVVTRKILRGTHLREIWDLLPTGNPVAWEFIDLFRVKDGGEAGGSTSRRAARPEWRDKPPFPTACER